MLSKTQIDKLGERLRGGMPTEEDLRALDEFRGAFTSACEHVVGVIRTHLGFKATARAAKSTQSIVDKLRRESPRLTQVQDIAGCRIVVRDVTEQDRVVAELRRVFDGVPVVDRRHKPSHGYRAVHVIPAVEGKLVEIQVRTELQHEWAQLSEKLADVVDHDIKYGGGPLVYRHFLDESSILVAKVEAAELAVLGSEEPDRDQQQQQLLEIRASLIQKLRVAMEPLKQDPTGDA